MMNKPQPTHVSQGEGFDWIPWSDFTAGLFHAIKFADGSIFDAVNGWRVAPPSQWPRPPFGYGRLPSGVRCRCVKLYQIGDDFYCCGEQSAVSRSIETIRTGTPRDQPTDDAFGLGCKLEDIKITTVPRSQSVGVDRRLLTEDEWRAMEARRTKPSSGGLYETLSKGVAADRTSDVGYKLDGV